MDVVQRGQQTKANGNRADRNAGSSTAKIVDRGNQRPNQTKQVESPKTGISVIDDIKQPSKSGQSSTAGKGSSNPSKSSSAKALSGSTDRPKTGISVVDDIKRAVADRNDRSTGNTSASRRDGLRVDESRNDRRENFNTGDTDGGRSAVNAFNERSGNRRGDRGGSSGRSRHNAHNGDWNDHHSSCGHSSCHGSSHCHFSSHFHDHHDHHHHHHGWHSSWWYPYNSFGFFYGSHGWSVGLSFSNYYWNDWCYPSHYWYADYYDPYVYWHGYYGSHWDDYRCYNYRPVYGYYRPRYHCYQPYYSSVTYSDYAYLDPYYDTSGYTVGSDYLAGGTTSLYPPSTYPPSTYPPQLSSANDGWEYLASGDSREARRMFDQAVTAYPSDGLPKIGYALSAALLDRDQEAAEYMRRALREDPESLREIPLSEDLRVQLRPLLDEYLRNSKQNPSDVDALLMLAVLHTIDGNDAMAYFAIDRAVDIGDRDVASGNLKRMIQQSLDREPVQPINPSPLPTPTPSPIEQPANQPADGVLY